jgi:hypothetical protein
MAVNLSPIGGVAGQFFDNNGNPLTGGKIYTYAAGTTTNQATYTSASGLTAHSNPIILDSAGRVPSGEIWLTDGLQYKFVIATSNDVLIGTYDNIIGINSNFVNFTNQQEIQTATSGQTVFTLAAMQYQPGTGSLSVFVDGVNQYGPGSTYAFAETSSTVVTFVSGLHVGASVKFTTSSINASSYGTAADISYTPAGTGAVATTVQAKLREGYASPEDFGAVGDGTDETMQIQKAFNTGKNIWLTQGKTYGITAELSSATANITITGGGTIKFLSTFNKTAGTLSALAVTGVNTTIDAVTFDGSAVTGAATNNRFVWCTAARLVVTSMASFLSLPKGGSNFNGAIGCTSLAPYCRVIGAYFSDNPGSIFFQGRNCVAEGNVIVNPNDAAIAFNGVNCYGCVATGNTINNFALNSCSAMIAAEEGASDWLIENNTIFGIKDGCAIFALNVAVFTTVRGGKIIGNVVDGGSGTTTNPSGFVNCSKYYTNVEISSNKFSGMPTGNSNSRLIVASANGGIINSNIIDGSACTGIGANVTITTGTNGITITNNTSYAIAGGRHFIFDSSDFGSYPCQFVGGTFIGGNEAINTATSAGTNIVIWLSNLTQVTATNVVNMVATMNWGNRQTYLNTYGAVSYPLSIKNRTVMYGNAVPTTGTWANGDTVYSLAPATGGFIGWVCTTAGTPGTWKTFGVIS